MKLVDDWKTAHKWFSMQATAILTFLAALQGVMTAYGTSLLTPRHFAGVMVALGVLIAVVRLIKQGD